MPFLTAWRMPPPKAIAKNGSLCQAQKILQYTSPKTKDKKQKGNHKTILNAFPHGVAYAPPPKAHAKHFCVAVPPLVI